GDIEQSTYKVLKRIAPNVVCLGYDQQTLKEDLERSGISFPVVVLDSYKPEELHNSLLGEKFQKLP
ncbi:MAG: hypothetical protein Q8P70_01320, partial [bacterium]|nr:hypothetical protein [bacterium]